MSSKTGVKSWGRTWCVVTGASKGLGAEICVKLASLMADGSRIFGMARSKEGLEATGRAVHNASAGVEFTHRVIDLGNCSGEDLLPLLRKSLEGMKNVDTFVIVHNIGSLSNLMYLRELTDKKSIDSYYQLNITNVIITNAAFLNAIRQHQSPRKAKTYVINISSLCSLQPFKSWALYCSGKAARDMIFKVLAIEEPEVRVLNYSPGPLDTDMLEVARTTTSDEEVRKSFNDMTTQGKLLTCETSIRQLLRIIQDDSFQSGNHIDYFDEI